MPDAHNLHEKHEKRVRALADCAGRGTMRGVDLHHRVSTEIALLAFHLEARLATPGLIDHLIDVGRRVGAPVVALDRLSDDERGKFLQYLSGFDMHVVNLPSAPGAVRLLHALCANEEVAPGSPVAVPQRPPLTARFRRGDSWAVGRISALARNHITIASPAQPRVGDIVDIELMLAGQSTLVSVEITHRSDCESGSRTFGGRFVSTTNDALVRGLLAVAGTDILVTPPPRRAHVRCPVRVPVSFEEFGTRVITVTTDLSRSGFFAYSPLPPAGSDLRVALALTGERVEVRGRARVRRRVDPQHATAGGVLPGFGAELHDLEPGAQTRLDRWLAAAAPRTARLIAVAASAERGARLVSALTAAGYAVSGPSRLDVILGQVLEGAHPPDVVVISRESFDSVSARRLLSFDVPLVRLDTEPADAACARVDQAVCG